MCTYTENNFKSRFDSTMQASDWLSKQLVDLQMKVETSQEKLVRYQKEHEILGIDEKQNITTSKLDELNKALTAAESERMDKRVGLPAGAIRRQPTPSRRRPACWIPSGGNSQLGANLLESLRAKQADLKIQAAELSTQFGPSYPKVAQLNSQLKEIEDQINLETKKVASKIRGQYLAALQRENMLHDALEKQKQEANKLNESAIQYSILKRDLDSYRQLYEGLMEKMKEAGVSAGLKSNNFRIVDVARVPTAPIEPNIPRNLAFALMLGLTSGVGLAFLLEGLDNTVRTTEQAQMISGLAPLGMIPMGSRNHARWRQSQAPGDRHFERSRGVGHAGPAAIADGGILSRAAHLAAALQSGRAAKSHHGDQRSAPGRQDHHQHQLRGGAGAKRRSGSADRCRSAASQHSQDSGDGSAQRAEQCADRKRQRCSKPSRDHRFFRTYRSCRPERRRRIPQNFWPHRTCGDVLEELRGQYDHIVVDTPPTLSVTDAVVLSPRADAIVLVIRSGQTTKQALRRSRDILMQVNAKVSGVLLNAVDLSSPDYYYYYEYQGKYSRYYRDDDRTTMRETAKPRRPPKLAQQRVTRVEESPR